MERASVVLPDWRGPTRATAGYRSSRPCSRGATLLGITVLHITSLFAICKTLPCEVANGTVGPLWSPPRWSGCSSPSPRRSRVWRGRRAASASAWPWSRGSSSFTMDRSGPGARGAGAGPRSSSACRSRPRRTGGGARRGNGAGDREHDAERRPTADLALHRDLAGHRLHDPVADVEPQARPPPDLLGREEGIEDPLADLGRDPAPRVPDLHRHPIRALPAGDDPDLVLRGPALRDGLRRVDEQVQEHLPQARLVGLDLGYPGVVLHQPRAIADLARGDVHRQIEGPLQIDRRQPIPAVRERLEVAQDR